MGAAVGTIAGFIALATAIINFTTARRDGSHADVSRSAHAVPDVIPSRVNMVNRDDELRKAMARIRAGTAVLAIEGEAGIGKSALATEIVHLLRTEACTADHPRGLRGHQFVWIDADHRCPTLAALCQALSLLTGDQALTTAPLRHKSDALRAHLASHETVLVIDDLKLSDDAASDSLRDFVRRVPDGSMIIASVSLPGTLDASCVRLGELDLVHTLTLVHHQARQLGLDPEGFDEVTVRRLQTALGGNPALIEWFVRAFRRSPDSLEAFLSTIERGERLPELFARVWSDLSRAGQTVLGACAYLHGDAIGDQLAVACAMSPEEVMVVLAALMREGLLTTTRIDGQPPRYTCGTALRRFVRDATPRMLVADFTSRLAHYYTQWFSADWENARSAASHVGAFVPILEELYAQGDDEAVRALFDAVLDIQFTLGLFDARIDGATIAYNSACRADNHRAASLAASVISSTHAIRGELHAADEAIAMGMIAAEASADRGELARQKRCRGFASYRAGRAEEALVAIDGAEELALEAGDLKGLVDILGLRTAALWYIGEQDEAEAVAQRCLLVCDQIPWERARAYPLRDFAEICICRGNLRQAREFVESARRVAIVADERRQLARIDLTEARLLLAAGNARAAAAQANRAASMAAALGLPPELREARALYTAAIRTQRLPAFLRRKRRGRATRLTDAPVGGD